MEQASCAVMVAAALAATPWNATAQDGDVAAGHTFARDACISCHVVEPENWSSRIVSIGPNFKTLQTPRG
jgi:cytochrome c2